jgi:thioredoxin 1
METFNDVISTNQPVLVDFFATWCGPCKMMHPILEQLKEALGDKLRIIKIDIDKNQAVANQFQIQSVPTMILFKDKKILWRQSGAMPLNALQDVISPFLA